MDARLESTGPRYALELERRLAHSPEKVWRVLTERELLKQWFPADVEGEWKVGAELQFIFLHGEGEGLSEDELRGEVLVVEPPRLLEFTWGTQVFRCEVIAEGEGCRLLFSGIFDDPSTGARDAAGWDFCFENLEAVARGAATTRFVWDEWQPRFEHYVAKFEPDYGPQQGPPENHPVTELGDESPS